MAFNRNDSAMLFEIASYIAKLYGHTGDYDRALTYYNKYPVLMTQINSSSINFTRADILSHLGQKNEAEKIYLHLLSYDDLYTRSNASLWLGNYACNKGDDKNALRFIREYVLLEDSLNILKNEEAVALSQSLYNYQLREKEIAELKLRETKQRAYTWIFTILAATAVGILYYIERARRQRIKRQYDHIQRLIASGKKHTELRLELSLATTADLKESDTYKRIRQKCESRMTLTKADWAAIEELFDTAMPEFLPKLRGIHTLNDTEWKLSLLTKMDFSWHEIASLVSRSYDAIYSSQNRLHKKVFNGDVTFRNWKEFINSL